MDIKYKKIVGNLSVNLAATTLKVKSRYSHRIGVNGKGVLNIYDDIKGLPNHKIFHLGTRYSVIVRHSNGLRSYDDARLNARGAVRIMYGFNSMDETLRRKLKVCKQSKKFCREALVFLRTLLLAASNKKPEPSQNSKCHKLLVTSGGRRYYHFCRCGGGRSSGGRISGGRSSGWSSYRSGYKNRRTNGGMSFLLFLKLEKIFPPGFFDSMEHLVVHLSSEALLGGPMQYRWMYLHERKPGSLKRTLRNKARVEGSIDENYLVNELSMHCSLYFDPRIETRLNREPWNFAPDIHCSSRADSRLNIFKVPSRRLFDTGTKRKLINTEKHKAHTYILLNCEDVHPFLRHVKYYLY
ncbi:putative transposon, En/Spm-like protein [Tanacetum coccineum]